VVPWVLKVLGKQGALTGATEDLAAVWRAAAEEATARITEECVLQLQAIPFCRFLYLLVLM
jgi:hypothetical protein